MSDNLVQQRSKQLAILEGDDSRRLLSREDVHSDRGSVMGTVVWIGPVDHPEFADAFLYLQRTAAQLAIRRNQRELLQRPATEVQRIVIARPRRIAILPDLVSEFKRRYPLAQVLLLNGSLCDGERRSEQAEAVAVLKSFVQIRFSQWREAFGIAPATGFHNVRGLAATPIQPPVTLLLFDRYSDAEPLLQLARQRQVPALWANQFSPQSLAGIQRIVWDESIAPKSPSWDWSKVISEAGKLAACEHHWLVTQPQIEDISYAMRAGVCAVHGKPLWNIDFLAIAD